MAYSSSIRFVAVNVSPKLNRAVAERRRVSPNKRKKATPIEGHFEKIGVIVTRYVGP
jgi:hypothetical protein